MRWVNMRYLLFFILIFISYFQLSNAQNNQPINSGEIIKKSAKLFDTGQYKSALTELNKISRSDTNYVWSLYERAISSEADSQYTQAVKYCQEALALKEQREFEPELFNTYGNTLNDMGQYEKAVRVFDLAIARYPKYPLFYFNKGIVLLAQNKAKEAELLFQKTLLMNPYLYSAHYQLGIAALKQGKIVPSFLSFIGYLLVNPAGKYWSKSINFLSKMSNGSDEILEYKNKRDVALDPIYKNVEDILLSKIALDPAYKPIISLDDPVCRQIQATFEKLEYSNTNKDFWIQYYLPFYKSIYGDGSFEIFINHMFSNVKNESIQNYNRKNKREMSNFVEIAGAYFNHIRATNELTYKNRDTITQRYYFDNGSYQGRGVLTNNGKTLLGPWEFYYPAGNLKQKENYNSKGEREGERLFYFMSGNLEAKENWVAGKLEGEQQYYFENGNLSSVENYSQGVLSGQATSYFYAGNKKSVSNYKMNKKDGESRSFYSNGNLLSVANYTDGLLNGNYMEYSKDGHHLKETTFYVNGKSDGVYKSYFENANVYVEGKNVKDNAVGEWKYYYESGKIKEKRNFVNSIEDGMHTEYFENGITSVFYNVKKGKINGEAVYYDKDGKVFAKYFYDEGVLNSISYFDKSGVKISTSNKVDNLINIITYIPSGIKKGHQYFNLKGEQDSADTLFYPTGKIHQVNTYSAGELNGKSVTYYLNGNKKSEINWLHGKENGQYLSYYFNGKFETVGWMADGQNEGEWITYDELGRVNSKSNYLAGDLNGYKEEYLPNGKKTAEEKYHRGWLEKMTQFDTTGKVLTVDSFPKGSGKYKLIYANGKTMISADYVNGDFDGAYQTFYFDGSAESISYYRKGIRDSIYKSFYYGGIKCNEGVYTSGSKSGNWKHYDEEGTLTSTTSYLNDQLNGESVYYFKDGTKDYVSYYKEDLLNGVSEKYDPDGTLAYQVEFDEGNAKAFSYLGTDGKPLPFKPISIANGALKSFFPNGKPSRECSYSDGIKNGPDIIYFPNGKIRSIDTASYGITISVSKEFNNNGTLKSVFNYKLDNASGICREFNDSGVIKKEYSFVNGINHGTVKYFDTKGKLSKTYIYYYGILTAVKNGE